jgi:hypothetical protein
MKVKERSWTSILINPPFQLKLMSYFVVLFILTTITLYSTTYLFFWNMKQKGLNVGIPEGHVYYQFLLNQKHDLDYLFIGLAAVNFTLLLVVGFIVSHRIAGPIHKVKQLLQNPDGFDKINMRENDFFKELGPIVNNVKDRIK